MSLFHCACPHNPSAHPSPPRAQLALLGARRCVPESQRMAASPSLAFTMSRAACMAETAGQNAHAGLSFHVCLLIVKIKPFFFPPASSPSWRLFFWRATLLLKKKQCLKMPVWQDGGSGGPRTRGGPCGPGHSGYSLPWRPPRHAHRRRPAGQGGRARLDRSQPIQPQGSLNKVLMQKQCAKEAAGALDFHMLKKFF